MVRVNHPPGGEAKLDSDGQRQQKTVRVLKPPGGGSSIFFGHDEKKSNGAPAPAEVPPTIEAPSPEPKTPETAKEETPVSSPPEESPQPSDSNGTSNGSPDMVSVPRVPPASPPPQSSSATECKSEPVVTSEESIGVTSSSEDRVCSTVVQEKATTQTHDLASTANEVATTTEVPVENSTTVRSNEAKTETQAPNVSNGSSEGNKPNLPPLSVQPNQTSSEDTPTSPLTPCSPQPKPNGDSRGRVPGQGEGGPSPSQIPQPRKVKDHMKSNIFMSDEDFTPTRSSRMNATVNDSPQATSAAGQRQRIPPGGFSSKLW